MIAEQRFQTLEEVEPVASHLNSRKAVGQWQYFGDNNLRESEVNVARLTTLQHGKRMNEIAFLIYSFTLYSVGFIFLLDLIIFIGFLYELIYLQSL